VNYEESMRLIDFLLERFRKAGMRPFYLWAIPITWEKLQKWAKMLGYKREVTNESITNF